MGSSPTLRFADDKKLDNSKDNLFSNLLKYAEIIKTEKIINYKNQAFYIIENINKGKICYIATALAYGAVIWSETLIPKNKED